MPAKGYELKATITLKDNFTSQMNAATNAVRSLQKQVESAQRAVSGFKGSSNNMFGTASRAKLASTQQGNITNAVNKTNKAIKQSADIYDTHAKTIYTWGKRSENLHKSELKMAEEAHRVNKRLNAEKVLNNQKTQNSMLNTNNRYRLMNENSEKDYARKRQYRQESWARQDVKQAQQRAEVQARAEVNARAKAVRRVQDFAYGTNSGYGKFQYGFIPQTMKVAGTAAMVGGGLAAAGAGAVAKSGISGALDFGDHMATIKSLTAGKEYSQWNKGLSDQVKTMIQSKAISSIYDDNEVATAYEEMLRSGRNHKQIKNGELNAVIDSAAATGSNPQVMAQLVATMQSVFEGTKVNKIADTVTGVSNASVYNPEDLVLMMQSAAPATKNVGWSFEDTALMGGALSKSGIVSGQMAGTLMRTAIPDLNPRTKPAKAAAAKYGLLDKNGESIFYNSKGDLKGPEELVKIMAKQFKGTTAKERDNAFQSISGDRGKMFLASLYDLGQNNAKKWNEFVTEAKSKTAKQAADDRMTSTKAKFDQLGNAFSANTKNAFSSAIEALNPAIDKATNYLVKMIPAVNKFGKAVGKDLANWFDDLFKSDDWTKAKGPKEKISAFFNQLDSDISSWWEKSGRKKFVDGASETLSVGGDIMLNVGKGVVSMLWDTVTASIAKGFKEHPLGTAGALAAVGLGVGGWVALKLANIIKFFGDLRLAFKAFKVPKVPTIPNIPGGGGGCCCGTGKDGKSTGGAATIEKDSGKSKGKTPKVSKGAFKWIADALKGAGMLAAIQWIGGKAKDLKPLATKLAKGGKALASWSTAALAAYGPVTDWISDELGNSQAGDDFRKKFKPTKGIKKRIEDALYNAGLENKFSDFVTGAVADFTDALSQFDSLTPSFHIGASIKGIEKAFEIGDKINVDFGPAISDFASNVSSKVQGLVSSANDKIKSFAANIPTDIALNIGGTALGSVSMSFGAITAALGLRDSKLVEKVKQAAVNLINSMGLPGFDLGGIAGAISSKISAAYAKAKSAVMSYISAQSTSWNSFPGVSLNRSTTTAKSTAKASTSSGKSNPLAKYGSRAGGEYRVPADGLRLVHRDETILPRGEARAYRNGGMGTGGAIITGNTFHVREEADVQRIAKALAQELLQG